MNGISSTPSTLSIRNGQTCAVCQKKLSLIARVCKCGKVLCGDHLMNDKHPCTFDWQAHGRHLAAESLKGETASTKVFFDRQGGGTC